MSAAHRWLRLTSSRGAIAALAATAAVTLAASPSQVPAPTTQPTFRTGTTLIEVSAIATRDGEVVTDLRADEVVVRDNGKPQSLVAFEFVDLTTQADSPEQRRDFVIVLDDLAIDPRQTLATRKVALALIDELGAHDRLAIVNTGPFELVQQLSTDREASRTLVRKFLGQKGAMTFPNQTCHNTVVTLKVISIAARVMGRGPLERRTIVVVGEGYPVYIAEWSANGNTDTCLEARAAYDEVVAATALTNTAIYGVDPRGLMASAPVLAVATGRDAVTAVASMAQDVANKMEARYHGTLGLMATSTGGTLTTDRNNLAADVPTMIRDSRQYYRIVYLQPEVPADELTRPRRIDVSVTRRDVEIRARQRYMPGGGVAPTP